MRNISVIYIAEILGEIYLILYVYFLYIFYPDKILL